MPYPKYSDIQKQYKLEQTAHQELLAKQEKETKKYIGSQQGKHMPEYKRYQDAITEVMGVFHLNPFYGPSPSNVYIHMNNYYPDILNAIRSFQIPFVLPSGYEYLLIYIIYYESPNPEQAYRDYLPFLTPVDQQKLTNLYQKWTGKNTPTDETGRVLQYLIKEYKASQGWLSYVYTQNPNAEYEFIKNRIEQLYGYIPAEFNREMQKLYGIQFTETGQYRTNLQTVEKL